MTSTEGFGLTLSSDQHTWDHHPHVVWDGVPVTDVRLYDVIASTLQVQGFAAAEHRGKPAIRLDVENVASGGKGRMVLTADQLLCDVKRYEGDDVAPSAREALLRRAAVAKPTSADTEPTTDPNDPYPSGAPEFDFNGAVRTWVANTSGAELYDDYEAQLFAYLCAGVEAYARLTSEDGTGTPLLCAWTLASIAENIAPGFAIGPNETVSSAS